MLRCYLGPRARSAFVLAVASLVLGVVYVAPAHAQQPHRIGRLLVVDPCPLNNIFEAEDTLTQVLAERGWKQGQNLLIDCISARGRLQDIDKLAAELVARKPEMIVTQSTPAIRAMIATKTTVPIVMSTPDPVGEGYAQNSCETGRKYHRGG